MISGMRAVRPSRISDRAQEFVALAAGLGREVIAMSARDSGVRQWCLAYLEEHLPPSRRDRAAGFLDQSDTAGAVALLSPSERFFLGHSYLADVLGRDTGGRQPGLVGLRTATDFEGDGARSRRPDGAFHSSSPPLRPKPAPPRFFSPALDRLTEILSDLRTDNDGRFREEINQYGSLLSRTLGLTQLRLAEPDSYELLQATAHPQMLYERICDLKIRLAEINYSLGLPAELVVSEGELAVRDILPKSAPVFTNTWKLALDQIERLGAGNALVWIEELLNEGVLIPADDDEKSK
jgi:hypothetical protein